MDYTVIGDTVNLASRLESLNKFYGSDIMISKDLYDEVSHELLCRPLDIVAVKGRSTATIVYELLTHKAKATDEQIEMVELYTKALWQYKTKDFNGAIESFQQVIRLKPDDLAARKMIIRCREFADAPPQNDWNGVYVLTEK